jgi:aspartate/methionine/tyrosine aminotransferase
MDEVRAMLREFRVRRELVVAGLNDLPGVSCVQPLGAFYAFPNISGTGMSARSLQDQLLEEAGVAMLAGTAFGEYGEGYMRVSYANSQDNIREALASMRELLERVAA